MSAPGASCSRLVNVGMGGLRRTVVAWAIRWGANADDAEDLAQDVLAKVILHSTQYRGESKLSSWVYRIARNEWLTCARRMACRSKAEALFARALPECMMIEDTVLSTLAARERMRRWVADGIMSRDELKLFETLAVRGLSSAEVGAMLGIKPQSVRARASKTAARVRRELAAQCG